MTDSTRDDVVVSFKPHPGFDSPLIVFKGKDAAEVVDVIGAAEESGIGEKVGSFDGALKAGYNLGRGLGAEPAALPPTGGIAQVGPAPQPAAPAAAAPAGPPGSSAPTCQHGTKQYRTGNGKNGREWKAWFCPSPKGTPDQCAAEWIK